MANPETTLIISAVDKTEGAINSVKGNLGALEGQFSRLSNVVSGFAAVAGVTAFAGIMKGAVDSAAGLHDMAQQTGATVESLSAMRGIAKLSGVDMEQLAGGLGKLSKNMLSATQGGGDTANIFKALGIRVKDTDGKMKSTDAVFVDFAKSLKNVSSGSERAAAAQLILGKSGAQMLPMMNDLAVAGHLQAKITTEQAAASDELQDNITRLGAVQKAWVTTVAMEIAPAANAFVDALLETATGANGAKKAAKDLAADGSIKEWAISAAKAGGFVVDSFDGAARSIKAIGITIGAAAAQASLIAQGNFTGAMAVGKEWLKDLDTIASKEQFSDVLARKIAAIGTASQDTSGKSINLSDALKNLAKNSDATSKALETLHISQMALVTKQAEAELNAITKQQDEYVKALQSALGPLESHAASLEREIEYYGMAESAIQSVIVSRIEEARVLAAENGAWPEHLEYLDREIELRQRITTAAGRKETLDVNKKAAEAAANEWKKFSDQVEQSLTDSLFRSFEAGKGFGETFVSSLKNTLKAAALKMVIQYVVSGSGQIVGTLGNAAINAALGTSGSNSGAGTNYLGVANNAQSLYSAYGAASQYLTGASAGASSASLVYANGVQMVGGDGIGALYAANGGWAGVEAGAGTTAAAGSGSSTAGLGVSTIGWVAAIVMGMYMSSEAWKNGIRWENYADNKDAQKYDAEVWLRASKDKPLAAIFGDDFVKSEFYAVMSGSSLSAQIHGALQKAMWGGDWKAAGDSRLSGNFSDAAGGFTSGQFAQDFNKKGGWFSSGKSETRYQNVSGELDSALDSMYRSIRSTYLMAGAIFEDDTLADKLKGFTLNFANLSGSNMQESITKISVQLSEAMGGLLFPSIAALRNSGEEWTAAFTRALTQTNAVNRLFVLTGKTLVSAFGRDNSDRILYMSDNLVRLFGTIDEMSSSFSNYYAAFYTQEEQAKQAWADLTAQLAGVTKAIPDSIASYRALIDSMDLTTNSGQSLFAALVKLSPTFAAVIDGTDKLAQETAAGLLTSYRAHADLIPALGQISITAKDAAISVDRLGSASGAISTVFLDASTPLLMFSLSAAALSPALTNSQIAAAALSAEIDALRLSTSSAQVDFAGLGVALAEVNTATFVATVAGVFDLLASRISGVIGSISTERAAVREAALSIINPAVMSKEAILRGIGSINTALPSQSGIVAANAALQVADRRKGTADGNVSNYSDQADYWSNQYSAQQTAITSNSSWLSSANARISYLTSMMDSLEAHRKSIGFYEALAAGGADAPLADGMNARGDTGVKFVSGGGYQRVSQITNETTPLQSQISTTETALAAAYDAAAVASNNYQDATNNVVAWQAEAAAAATQQATAQAVVKTSILAYTAAIEEFAVDASKSVTKLSRLREETVKYYEAQKALAELMGTSAAGLRSTVADYRYAQLTDTQQYEKLQTDYATAYSMALSTSGESLSSYGDRLNAILPALLEKASAVLSGDAYSAAAATAIARAEAIAAKLETTAPTNYAADSLDMLTNIDETLAALDASTSSAEKIISDAVKAGSDRNAAGLRAVIAALTGQAIPAFAGGGDHVGGYRLVGENGPEIESTGPSRIFNASQTRQILGGGSGNTARLEALVERQARQLESMSYELRAIASSNARLARLAEIQDRYGLQVHTESGTPLQVEAL